MNSRLLRVAAPPLVLALTLLAPGLERSALAQAPPDVQVDKDQVEEVLKQIAKVAVRKTRRMVAVGPLVSGFGGVALDGMEPEGGVGLGLGVYLFKIPLYPDAKEVQEIIKAKIKDHLKERLKLMVAEGRSPTDAELRQMSRDIFTEVKDEIVAMLLEMQPKKLEKPRMSWEIEADYLFRVEGWQVRNTFTFGVGPVSIGPTITGHYDSAGGGDLLLGPELGLHLLAGKGVRTPIVDVFARADFALFDRDEHADLATLGVRLMLDAL